MTLGEVVNTPEGPKTIEWETRVPSLSIPNLWYTVRKYTDGSYYCSCPGRACHGICHHITGAIMLLEGMAVHELKDDDDLLNISLDISAFKQSEVMMLKSIVASVLDKDKHARDDDRWLILRVLKKLGFRVLADYEAIKHLPSFESITRCRRKFQANGEYPGSDTIEAFRADNERQMEGINRWVDEDPDNAINQFERV